jgi:hypothetical protein
MQSMAIRRLDALRRDAEALTPKERLQLALHLLEGTNDVADSALALLAAKLDKAGYVGKEKSEEFLRGCITPGS